MPLISVIVVHDQSKVSHETYLRGQKSLEEQTFRDFETLRYHNGPLVEPANGYPIAVTRNPLDEWGHFLRDRGIHEARGEYILHFHSENVLYPNALEEIAKAIHRPYRVYDEGRPVDANGLILFPVIRWGALRLGGMAGQLPGRRDFYLIFDGCMIEPGHFDSMQLVMRRDLWLAEGGWSDRRKYSHGVLYERFLKKYGYRHISPILGESGPG